MKQLWAAVRDGAVLWYDRDGDSAAAVTSYYALFALVPLLYLSITVGRILYPESYVSTTLYEWGSVLGTDTLLLLKQATANLADQANTILIPSLGAIFFSGMIIVLFNTVTSNLHRLWAIPHRGLRGWFKKSAQSILFTIVFEVYLLVLLGAAALIAALEAGPFSLLGLVLGTAFFVVTTTGLFSFAYGMLSWDSPSRRARLWGAFVASVLLAVGRVATALYLTLTPVPDLFGPAGLVVALLLWLYVTAAIFYFGAAIAKAVQV